MSGLEFIERNHGARRVLPIDAGIVPRSKKVWTTGKNDATLRGLGVGTDPPA
jgi:hypothetical protein